jgi:hypothetical protein
MAAAGVVAGGRLTVGCSYIDALNRNVKRMVKFQKFRDLSDADVDIHSFSLLSCA